GALDDHNAFQCLTGRTARNQPPGGWPCMGSVLSKLYGPVDKAIPSFVGLAPKMGHMEWADNGMPGFLGVGHAPFQPNQGYGKGDPNNRDDGGPKLMEQFLIARRLVEAGARCVTLAFSRWDHHGDNFGALRQDLPLLDQGVSALIEDLHRRGLEKDVSVVMWGEFGRTPTINKDAGRD